jgi:hypothetical protein
MIKIAIALGVLVAATLIMKKPGMSYRQSVLKTLYPAIMWSSKAAGKKQTLTNTKNAAPTVSFYTLSVKDINGNEFKFSDLKITTLKKNNDNRHKLIEKFIYAYIFFAAI